jgi:predicted Zn-dependent protease
MRQRVHFLRVLAAVALLAVCAGSAQAQIGRVNGVVKDEGGLPLKGVTITADNSNIGQTLTATTDDKGRFNIIGLRAGQWRFIAQAPGFASEVGTMPVRMGGPNPPVAFTLHKNGVGQFGALGGITNRELQTALSAGDAAFDRQQWDAAIDAYRGALNRSPALAIINLQIAEAQRSKRDFDAALESYRALLAVDPDNSAAHLGIAATERERGNAAAAEAALLAAAQRDSVHREVLFELGELKLAANLPDEAAEWYRKANAADPIWGKPLYKLGLDAMKKGNNSDATKLLSEVIAVDPTSPEAALAKSSLELLKK